MGEPQKTVHLIVQRQDLPDSKPYTEEFVVPWSLGMNVVSALMAVQKNPVTKDGKVTKPVVWECNCLEEVCGACAMMINGKPRQACSCLVDSISQPIRLAPLSKFPVVRDLMVDRQKMFDVVSTSSGSSWSMNAYCPAPGVGPASPADNGYKPGFAADLMLKDLRLSQQAAEGADADTPMGALAAELYRRFVEEEDGRGMDFSAMLPRFVARHRD